ncbi:MAG: hypothetical protein KC416_15800, partial [Myxococcales bacterium]|nr:hypothetical protein [Myxococcales bacterium]
MTGHPRRSSDPPDPGTVTGVRISRVSLPDNVSVEDLWQQLREGLGKGDGPRLREQLGLPEDAPDKLVARDLVRILSASELLSLRVSSDRRDDPRPSTMPARVTEQDASFLGTLETGFGGHLLEDVEDVRTVIAVARAGGLRQRRLAVYRLEEMWVDRRGHSPDELKSAAEALQTLRDPELAYELGEGRMALPGLEGRKARADRDDFRRLVDRLGAAVDRFWDGHSVSEPVSLLPGDERAWLLMRTRDLPDELVRHLGAIAEGSAGAR